MAATGTVTIIEGAAKLCTINLSKGKGTCMQTKSQLAASTYKVFAAYGGTAAFKASTSTKTTLTVKP